MASGKRAVPVTTYKSEIVLRRIWGKARNINKRTDIDRGGAEIEVGFEALLVWFCNSQQVIVDFEI